MYEKIYGGKGKQKLLITRLGRVGGKHLEGPSEQRLMGRNSEYYQ